MREPPHIILSHYIMRNNILELLLMVDQIQFEVLRNEAGGICAYICYLVRKE
jgi:hypothetical protein